MVTGGAGFLGSFVLERLAARGCRNVFVPHKEDYDLTREDDIRRARFELNLQLAGLWSTRDFSRPEKLMDEAQRDASRL